MSQGEGDLISHYSNLKKQKGYYGAITMIVSIAIAGLVLIYLRHKTHLDRSHAALSRATHVFSILTPIDLLGGALFVAYNTVETQRKKVLAEIQQRRDHEDGTYTGL